MKHNTVLTLPAFMLDYFTAQGTSYVATVIAAVNLYVSNHKIERGEDDQPEPRMKDKRRTGRKLLEGVLHQNNRHVPYAGWKSWSVHFLMPIETAEAINAIAASLKTTRTAAVALAVLEMCFVQERQSA